MLQNVTVMRNDLRIISVMLLVNALVFMTFLKEELVIDASQDTLADIVQIVILDIIEMMIMSVRVSI